MEKSFKRERVITSIREVNKIIKLIKDYGLKVIKIGIGGDYRSLNEYLVNNPRPSLSGTMIIEQKETKLYFSTRYYEHKPATYVFNLNGEEMFAISGSKCFAEFSRYFKIPKASTYNNKRLEDWFDSEKGSYTCSASPVISFNPKYEKQELKDVWEYDLNSAYATEMLDEVPDLWHPRFKRDQKVKKGYVGFYLNDSLTMTLEGQYADVTFPLIKTPEELKNYCLRWFERKSKTEGVEKLESKAYLNLPIGYCQRFNPFFRSYIVHKCNLGILKKIDKNSIFWNTDAIFSLKRRTDLEIGDKIGQFKEKHFRTVRYIGNTYQTDEEIPVWRGVPKQWFKEFEKQNGRKFNILIDEVPMKKNLYYWDWDNLRLEKKYE